jgi:hypothetical protein
MNDVIEFMKDFINQEYETLIHIRTELDAGLVETKINILNRFFQGLNSGLYLSNSRTLEAKEVVISQLQPRKLFQVKQYLHPTIGILYRGYLSSSFYGDQDYFANFFIAATERGLKIISRYHLCNTCNGAGHLRDNPCMECHGFGWQWRGGSQLNILGEFVAVQQFQSPSDMDHLHDYQVNQRE